MDTPPEPQRIFRCPRCRHVDFESVPHPTQCPRCGLAVPPSEHDDYPGRRLQLQLMRQPM